MAGKGKDGGKGKGAFRMVPEQLWLGSIPPWVKCRDQMYGILMLNGVPEMTEYVFQAVPLQFI